MSALISNVGYLETFPYQPALVPPPVAAALLEKGLFLAREMQAKIAAAPPTREGKAQADRLAAFVTTASKRLDQLRAQLGMTPVTAVPAKTGPDVMWRSGTPEWNDAFEDAFPFRLEDRPYCLVDGGVVWGFIGPRGAVKTLFQVDAATGRQLSIRLWQLTRAQEDAAGETYQKSIRSMDRGHAELSDNDQLGGPWLLCRWRDSVCVSMWGLGVCLVPVQAASKGEVFAIGRRQGMPALDLIGVAPAGDTLYIASRQALVAATAGQDQVKLIANLAGDTTASSLPRGWAIRALVADRAGKNLYLLLREPLKTLPAGYRGPLHDSCNRRCSVWALEIATGRWRLVRDELVLNVGQRNLHPPFGDAAKPKVPPRPPAVPGTAEEAAEYLVRWADELLGLSMATLADGSVIVTDRNADDGEFCIYRAPAPPPPKPAP